MKKPIYKYATIWGIIGGTALAFIYIKTLGKGKGISLDKALLIGGSIGAGLGLGIDLINRKPTTPISEQELVDLAKSIGGDSESELDSYLSSVRSANLSDSNIQRLLALIKVFLTAKKNGEWDSKGDIETKKKVLISNGVSKDDVDLFEITLKNHLTNVVSNMMKVGNVEEGTSGFEGRKLMIDSVNR